MHMELEPLGLRSFIFEPGYFRTSFLAGDNVLAPTVAPTMKNTDGIADYSEATKNTQDALLGEFRTLWIVFLNSIIHELYAQQLITANSQATQNVESKS